MSTPKWREEHKTEMAEYRRKWYQQNKKRFCSKTKERVKRNRRWIAEYKLKCKCEVCNANHPAILQFHHKDPTKKLTEIGRVSKAGWSIEKIKEEIDKCRILCANCHFIFHWNEKHNIVNKTI